MGSEKKEQAVTPVGQAGSVKPLSVNRGKAVRATRMETDFNYVHVYIYVLVCEGECAYVLGAQITLESDLEPLVNYLMSSQGTHLGLTSPLNP